MSSSSSYPRKRKHSELEHRHARHEGEPDPALFIQAHEADIVRGPQALVAAKSLEVSEATVGSGLIRWGGEVVSRRFTGEDDEGVDEEGEEEKDAVWVDRYDARLLLDRDSFASTQKDWKPASAPTNDSDSDGWSDLPSDAEDTFFLTPEEIEDYKRDKRRRDIERSREARLKARMDEDGVTAEDVWGGSDEEPEEPQKDFMRRTAKHILSSPNPAQLEMRILANHGADKRFAFLRGRWSRSWQVIKAKLRMELEKEEEERKRKSAPGLGSLGDYGDSSDEEDGAGAVGEIENEARATSEVGENEYERGEEKQSQESIEAEKEARRARAKEWMAKRRALDS
ncbi:hypothetical protein VNI00_012540 [Paramarasmius palmivorus]|uniref:Rrn9 domain-containing protein n=1 Tax=Paramarasmius palmivorus TaxID=297713 RepID=A0AAW0C306_9AGAR